MVQLQQAMQHFSSAGLAPGSAGAGLGDFGLGGLGPLPPAPPVANPQDFYSSQLQQLQVCFAQGIVIHPGCIAHSCSVTPVG